jgi:hypothetical protein
MKVASHTLSPRPLLPAHPRRLMLARDWNFKIPDGQTALYLSRHGLRTKKTMGAHTVHIPAVIAATMLITMPVRPAIKAVKTPAIQVASAATMPSLVSIHGDVLVRVKSSSARITTTKITTKTTCYQVQGFAVLHSVYNLGRLDPCPRLYKVPRDRRSLLSHFEKGPEGNRWKCLPESQQPHLHRLEDPMAGYASCCVLSRAEGKWRSATKP